MITEANANRSTVFEPNDLLLPAAYEAVGNALWAKKEVQGIQNSDCAKKLTCVRSLNNAARKRSWRRGGVEKNLIGVSSRG